MLEQNLVDLRRSDLLAAAIDDLAPTTDQKEISPVLNHPPANAAYVADANADGGHLISPPAKFASIQPRSFDQAEHTVSQRRDP
jgi:hypothetical protein